MGNCVNCTDIGAETAINGNRYLCDECRKNKREQALENGLFKMYESEFVVVDGINQHKDGLSYYEWLRTINSVINESMEQYTQEVDTENDTVDEIDGMSVEQWEDEHYGLKD